MSDIYLFADDAKIFRHILNTSDFVELQNGIDALQSWSDKWLLKLNSSKCKVISFGRSIDKSHTYNLTINGQTYQLARESQINDLGVTLDGKLCFSEHMHVKINKAYAMLGLLNEISNI